MDRDGHSARPAGEYSRVQYSRDADDDHDIGDRKGSGRGERSKVRLRLVSPLRWGSPQPQYSSEAVQCPSGVPCTAPQRCPPPSLSPICTSSPGLTLTSVSAACRRSPMTDTTRPPPPFSSPSSLSPSPSPSPSSSSSPPTSSSPTPSSSSSAVSPVLTAAEREARNVALRAENERLRAYKVRLAAEQQRLLAELAHLRAELRRSEREEDDIIDDFARQWADYRRVGQQQRPRLSDAVPPLNGPQRRGMATSSPTSSSLLLLRAAVRRLHR